MATITVSTTVNLSATAFVDGDSILCNSGADLSLDVDCIIGNSPASAGFTTPGSPVLSMNTGSTVRLKAGKLLTLRGEKIGGNAEFIMEAGSILEFDSHLASSPTSQNYQFILSNAASQTNGRFTTQGTSGSHCIVRNHAGGGSGWFWYGTTGGNGAHYTCTYTDFQGINLPATNIGLYVAQSSGSTVSFTHCTFDSGCGGIQHDTTIPNDATFTFTDNVHDGAQANTFSISAQAANPTTGARTISRNWIAKQIKISPQDITIEDNYLRNGYDVTTSSGVLGSFKRNLVHVAEIFASGVGHYGSAQDNLFLADNADAAGNAHIILPRKDGTYHHNFWDSTMVVGIDSSDALYTQDSIALTVTNNFICWDDISSSGAGTLNGNGPTTWIINHNSAWVVSQLVSLGDLNLTAGTILQYKSNLAMGSSAGQYHASYVHNQADPNAAGVPDVMDGSAAVYNARFGLTAGQDGKGYNTDCSVTPGANDISLAADPCVDSKRNLGRWAVARGYSAASGTSEANIRTRYADAITALKVNFVTRFADATSWIEAGWNVTNVVLQNAGHDGVTIGAADFTTGVPSAPAINTAEASDSGINVSIIDNDAGDNVISYTLERKIGSGPFSAIATGANGSTFPYIDTGTTLGDSVTYRLKATNANGDSAYSSTVNVTSQGPGGLSSPSRSTGLSIGIGIGL